jgi:hypothetical protein
MTRQAEVAYLIQHPLCIDCLTEEWQCATTAKRVFEVDGDKYSLCEQHYKDRIHRMQTYSMIEA